MVRLLLNIYVLLKSKILLEFPHFIMQAVKTIFLRITCVIYCLDVVCMRLLVLFNFQIYWGVGGISKPIVLRKMTRRNSKRKFKKHGKKMTKDEIENILL